MRIGIILSQTPGYSETFFTSKIQGLQSHGCTVQLFVQHVTKDFALCPVKVAPKVHTIAILQLFKMGWVYATLLPHLGRVLKFIKLERAEGTTTVSLLKKIFLNAHLLKAQLDWVHFGFATQALGSELVAKAIGAKMGVSFRGFDINVFPIKFPGCYNRVWKHVDKVHSISNYLFDKAIGLGLPSHTSHAIITPAVALNKLLTTATVVTNEVITLVTIARLHWIKGLDTAIAAVKLLREAGFTFKYHIIGDGSTKEQERYLFHAYELGVQDCIVFHGALSHTETLQFLKRADIYVQPSVNEGFCNAVLEAQALGKLVIASNVGGLPENIVDKETGWLVPEGAPAALAEKIRDTLQLPLEEKQAVAQKAIARVQAHFTIEKQQKAFVQFYAEEIG